jgi:hypothetical protein
MRLLRRPSLWLTLAAVVAAIISVLVAPSLGYDSWGWMTWGRELAHGQLNTLSGPSWKPGPAIVSGVISVFAGSQAPFVWLFLVRLCVLAGLAGAFVAARGFVRAGSGGNGWRRAPGFGGLMAVVMLATSTDLVKTAMYGSSEPVIVTCVVWAIVLHQRGHRFGTLSLLALAGLMRPEAWVMAGLYALWIVWRSEPKQGWYAGALLFASPVIWLGLDWAGSGRLSQSADTAEHLTASSAARAAVPAFEVLQRATEAVTLPALLIIVVGVVAAARRRDPVQVCLAAAAALWIALIAVQAQLGFSGDRRYLAAAAAVLCVVGAAGTARALSSVWVRPNAPRFEPWPAVLVAVLVVLLAGFSLIPLRNDAREVSAARQNVQQRDELRRAVTAAGGIEELRLLGHPVVNPYLQTSLAWILEAPIPSVQAAWQSTVKNPRWSPPAVLFIAPKRYAGTRPALPPGVATEPLAHVGRWRVLDAR